MILKQILLITVLVVLSACSESGASDNPVQSDPMPDNELRSGIYDGYEYNYIHAESQVAYLILHGGGWTHGDISAGNIENICKELFDKKGLTVVNLNYPLSTETVHSREVIDWINKASADLKVAFNVKRWILVGTSAGANLGALIVPLSPENYQAFFGFYGVYDLSAGDELNDTVNQRKDIFVPGGDYSEYSPSRKYWPEVPAYLWHGDSDSVVHIEQSEDFRVTSGGELTVMHGLDHGFRVVDYL